VFGALLTPSALAVIIAAFPPVERGAAIGSWTAWTGIAFVVGPVAGGTIVDNVDWRWIFAINVPFVILTLVLVSAAVEQRPTGVAHVPVDWAGAALCAVGLGGPVFALVRQPEVGWGSPEVWLPLVAGLAVFAAFLARENRTPFPMLPLGLFARRNFAIGNVETLAMYGGLSISSFVTVLFLQEVAGYSAVQSGLATVPTTLVMFLLSKRMGALADRFGPRRFMGFGPIVAGAGLLLYQRVGRDAPYVSEVLPAVVVFAIGLSMTVAPLTATVMADADERNAGIASGVNNAVARVAALLGVALVGLITGEAITLAGFHQVTLVAAVLLVAAGLLGLAGIRDPGRDIHCADCPGGALAGAPIDPIPEVTLPEPAAA
jgi:MFS family permease